MSNPSPARVAAFHALLKLHEDETAFSAETLSMEIQARQLLEADAKLASAIVYGVLRHALALDNAYRPWLKQAPSRLSVKLRLLLRMAAAQHYLLSRIPPHAIASDTVELARRVVKLPARESGFLNAIVRKIVAQEAKLPASASPDVQHSMPPWLTDLFRNQFGEDYAAILLPELNLEPRLTLRANRLRGEREQLVEALQASGARVQPGLLSPDALLVDELPVQSLLKLPQFVEGQFYLQDEGSQIVALLAAPRPAEQVLDYCSAPGGKTTHLAEVAGGQADITATDVSDKRLGLVRENLARLQTPGVKVISPEDRAGTLARQAFDLVLVDAPCSGLGTLRHNPEIRYRVTPEKINRIAELQFQVLTEAAVYVRAGGRLVYSTCTVTREENEDVINRFLQRNTGYSIRSEADPRLEAIATANGWYATWPAFPGMDGFKAIVLERNA